MGNIRSSSNSNSNSSNSNNSSDSNRKRSDVHALGERVSFGDGELLQLYDIYQIFLLQSSMDQVEAASATSTTTSSFFCDWYRATLEYHTNDRNSVCQSTNNSNSLTSVSALASTIDSSHPQQQQQPQQQPLQQQQPPAVQPYQAQQLKVMQYIVQQILPSDFDNALYRTCFLLSDGLTDNNHNQNHSSNSDSASDTTTTVMCTDESTRTTKLYHFFNALSVCNGRKGSKDSMTLFFRTVQALQLQQQLQQQQQQQTSEQVSAQFLMETGYRIAVAIAYIEQQPPPASILPPLLLSPQAQASIQALARSVVEQRNKRQQRPPSLYTFNTNTMSSSSVLSTPPPPPVTSNSHDDHDDYVELVDVLEWMEIVAPMFPYILPTFVQYLLFPNIPSRSTDDDNNKNSNTTGTNESTGSQKETTTTANTNQYRNNNITSKVLGRTTFTIPKIITLSDQDQCRQDKNGTLLNPSSHSSLSSSLSFDPSTLLPVRHFILACWNKTLNGYYYPIYNSNIDGLSFNRLQNAVLGYGGPTIVILQSVSGGIFGAYTGTAWKESKDFYGNTDSFLYQLQPQVAVYRPKSTGVTNYMYCNSTARSRGYDQQAHGIGFGGTVQQPRLFLSESMEDGSCQASAQDLTYDNGTLLPNVGTSGHYYNPDDSQHPNHTAIQRHRSIFDMECMEVYGVSDDTDVIRTAIGSRTLNRANQDELIRKARTVDKAQFLEDFQSGIIASKAFVHRQQIDGRAEVDDDCLLKKQQKELE